MSYLTSLLTSFCAASVFIGALYMLCPDGVMKKSVKYILSLVFLVSVIASSGAVTKNINVDLPKTENIDSYNMEIANAEYVYSYALESEGIDFEEISIYTDKSDDGSISINKVLIRSDANRERIIAALEGLAENIEVEIIND